MNSLYLDHELHKYMNDLASSQLQEDHHILPIFQMFTDLPHSKITGLEIDWQKKSACITKEVFFKLTACIESSYSDFRKNFEFLVSIQNSFLYICSRN